MDMILSQSEVQELSKPTPPSSVLIFCFHPSMLRPSALHVGQETKNPERFASGF